MGIYGNGSVKAIWACAMYFVQDKLNANIIYLVRNPKDTQAGRRVSAWVHKGPRHTHTHTYAHPGEGLPGILRGGGGTSIDIYSFFLRVIAYSCLELGLSATQVYEGHKG
jgi:hypothetical protein